MGKTSSWLATTGLTLVLATMSADGWAREESATGRVLAGLVGTVIAVVPESQILVVDVPLERDRLRVGAWVTNETRIEARGVPVSLDSLEPGARVRIDVRRIPTGHEAISVVVLQQSKS
jgi:hypothetical protein